MAGQHSHDDANRGNHNAFLPQHVEALEEVVEHQAMLQGETDDGDGDHGRNTSPEILLPNLKHYTYQTASAEVASF